jgi:hypothetical protein
MESGLITYLEAQTAITDIVGASGSERIYMLRRPEGADLPALVITLEGREHQAHATAASGLARSDIEIDCQATTYSGAKTLADAVRGELDGFQTAAMGTATVRRVSCVGEIDHYEQPLDESDSGVYHVFQDYDFWHLETVPTF